MTPVLIAVMGAGCGRPTPTTSNPPPVSSVVFTAVAPPSGSAVVVPEAYTFFVPGGVVIPPGSGLMSVGLDLSSAHDVPWAQLNVYLLTDEPGVEYCGQNSPDSPTWQFLTPGWKTHVAVSGFRVSRLPCKVAGIRAMLHMRNTGSYTPPTLSETIAEATFPVTFQIRR